MRAFKELSITEGARLAFAVTCPHCDVAPGNPCTKTNGKPTEPHSKRRETGYAVAFRVAAAAVGSHTVSPRAALDLYECGMDSFKLRALLKEAHPEAFA